MSNFDLQFEEVFKISTIALKANRSHPSIARDIKWFIEFLMILLITVSCFVFLTYSILFNDIKSGKFSEASKNGTIVIVSITVTLKYIVLLHHQESFKYLISIVDKDYEAAKVYSEEDKAIVLKYAKRGATVSKFWLVFGFGTSAIFPIKAFTLMAYHYWKGENLLIPMFDLTYPELIEKYKDVAIVFWSLFMMCFLFGTYASSMYVGFDPLVPILMLHTCGQVHLVSRQISTLFEEDIEDVRKIEENLKKVILKLQDQYKFVISFLADKILIFIETYVVPLIALIYRLVNLVKTNFSVLYEYIMKATSFLLPLTTFQIVDELKNGVINIEFLSFFVGCILHFYMPCYYSDLLMETSEHYRQAIYACGWEKCPDKRIRKIVLFMIARARLPMGITTVFYQVNLDTFAEMCRQSYGLFNLMNAAWA